MDTPTTGSQESRPGLYEIRLQGHLDPRWATWFDGMTLTAGSDGTTLLYGPVVDQAALHGLLNRLRDVGLPLVSVARVETGPRENDPTTPQPRTPENSEPGD
ncbi:hypothetical protein ACFVT5_14945 [Streptomyces sp. NPDC058001]|uniref:hypothetical protein n=1 Tax=Streptomyces sp. NPDC058001 TaxID=3346300 RepID=UPI0036F1864B